MRSAAAFFFLLSFLTTLLLLRDVHPSMQIISLQSDFETYLAKSVMSTPEQKPNLWDEVIEQPHQDFYDQVIWEKGVRENWSEIKKRYLPPRLAGYLNDSGLIRSRFEQLPQIISSSASRMRGLISGFIVEAPIYLALAPNLDAKSGVLRTGDNTTVVLAFAVDSLPNDLTTENVNILVSHEMFHAFHAKLRGFLNDGVFPGATLSTALWEEGLATLVSGLANPNSADSDLLFEPKFTRVTGEDVRWLARSFLRARTEPVMNPAPTEIFKLWFNVTDKILRADLPNRCGYLLGLHVMRYLVDKYGLNHVIETPPEAIDARAIEALQAIAEGKSE